MSAHCSSVRPRLGGSRAMALAGGLPGIQDSMTAGKNFIDASMAAGVKFLNKLMGISQL